MLDKMKSSLIFNQSGIRSLLSAHNNDLKNNKL